MGFWDERKKRVKENKVLNPYAGKSKESDTRFNTAASSMVGGIKDSLKKTWGEALKSGRPAPPVKTPKPNFGVKEAAASTNNPSRVPTPPVVNPKRGSGMGMIGQKNVLGQNIRPSHYTQEPSPTQLVDLNRKALWPNYTPERNVTQKVTNPPVRMNRQPAKTEVIKGMQQTRKEDKPVHAPDNMTYLQSKFSPEELYALERNPRLMEELGKLQFEQTGAVTEDWGNPNGMTVTDTRQWQDPISGRNFGSRRAAILGRDIDRIDKDMTHLQDLEIQDRNLQSDEKLKRMGIGSAERIASQRAAVDRYGYDKSSESSKYRVDNAPRTVDKAASFQQAAGDYEGPRKSFDPRTGKYFINGMEETKYNTIQTGIEQKNYTPIFNALSSASPEEMPKLINMIPAKNRRTAYEKWLKQYGGK